MTAPSLSSRKRRYLIAAVVCLAAAGIAAYLFWPRSIEEHALRQLRARGGMVMFGDDPLREGKTIDVSLEGAPGRSEQLTEEDLCSLCALKNIRTLRLNETDITGARMKTLRGLKVSTIVLAPAQINDEMLAGLREANLLEALHQATKRERQVVMLDLSATAISDAGLKELADLKALRVMKLREVPAPFTGTGFGALQGLEYLEEVDLTGAHVTEDGLRCLGKLRALQRLSLQSCRMTDDKLRALRDMHGLRTLILSNFGNDPGISDAGLRELRALKALRELELGETAITDKGLEELAAFHPALQKLDLTRTNVTDEGLEHLQRLPALQDLNLFNVPGISDKGCRHLGKLYALRSLQMSSAESVTDAGLKELHGLKALQELRLPTKNITKAGVAALQEALPRCRVWAPFPD